MCIPPPVYCVGLEETAMRTWAHYANDGVDMLAAKRPDRLAPLYHLPVTHPALAAEVVTGRAKTGKARFAMPAGSQDHKVILSDPAYGALWTALIVARAVLFLHPRKGCHPRYETVLLP